MRIRTIMNDQDQGLYSWEQSVPSEPIAWSVSLVDSGFNHSALFNFPDQLAQIAQFIGPQGQ